MREDENPRLVYENRFRNQFSLNVVALNCG